MRMWLRALCNAREVSQIRTCPHRVNVQIFEHNFVAGQGENLKECCRISRIFNAVIDKICRKDVHESLCGQVLR